MFHAVLFNPELMVSSRNNFVSQHPVETQIYSKVVTHRFQAETACSS